MKRTLCLLLAIFMLGTMLVSCQNNDSQKKPILTDAPTDSADLPDETDPPKTDDTTTAPKPAETEPPVVEQIPYVEVNEHKTAQTWYSSANKEVIANRFHVLVLDDILTYTFYDGAQSNINGYIVNRLSAGVIGRDQYTSSFDFNTDFYLDMVRNTLYDYTYQGVIISITNRIGVSTEEFNEALDKIITMVREMQPNAGIIYAAVSNKSGTDLEAVKELIESRDAYYYAAYETTAAKAFRAMAQYLDSLNVPLRTELPEGAIPYSEYKDNREELAFFIYDVDDSFETSGLPRALLIGDSISHGYYSQVREMMQGECIIDNLAISLTAADSTAFCRSIQVLLSNYDYDIIQFNVGIHTSGYDEIYYTEGVAAIMDYLLEHAPNAQIVFAATTSIGANTSNPWVEKRNNAAAAEAAKRNIIYNDLYEVCMEEDPPKGDVYHFSDYTVLSEQICRVIRDILA